MPRLGAGHGRPDCAVWMSSEVLKAGGTGIRKLATLHNVGTGTVQRIKDAIASNEAA